MLNIKPHTREKYMVSNVRFAVVCSDELDFLANDFAIYSKTLIVSSLTQNAIANIL